MVALYVLGKSLGESLLRENSERSIDFSDRKAPEVAQLRSYKARHSFQLVAGYSQAVPQQGTF